MEPQSSQQPVKERRTLKALYWLAAAGMAIATVLEVRERPDYLKIGSRVALLIALVLLATARPAESRGKRVLIFALVAVALGLLILQLMAS